MNLRQLIARIERHHALEKGFLTAAAMAVGYLVGSAIACSGAQSPDPKPALDFGQQLAVEFCRLEAPRRGFDPALCVAGSDFLRPFVDDAAKQFASAALADRGSVAASVPCPPFADSPAPAPLVSPPAPVRSVP